MLENRNGNIIGIEVKATASIKQRFTKGLIFYGGEAIMLISAGGFLFYCIPLGVLG